MELSAEFPQLVLAMRLSSGKCLKFLQIELLYKLDVIYLKSKLNEASVPSVVNMYQKSRYKDFFLLVEKIELSI